MSWISSEKDIRKAIKPYLPIMKKLMAKKGKKEVKENKISNN